MPTSCQIFYDFINDLGDVKGITLIAMYADLRFFQNALAESGGLNDLREAARTIMEDYCVDDNTY